MKLANDLIFTNIDTITAFDPTSGNYLFTLDELTSSTIAHTEETQDITGKNGRLLSRTKRNKGVTISGTNGIVSGGLMALQTGGEYTDKEDAEVMWSETLTVETKTVSSTTTSKATTTWKAVGTAGAEIAELYIKTSSNGLGTELTQATTLATGKFTYDPSTKTLSFYVDSETGAEIADGTEIYVCYKRKVAATTLDNDSDVYSGKAMLYVDGLAEDRCSNVYRVQFFFPKVDFTGEFSLEFSDSGQVAHSFEATAMAGACGAGTKYYTYTVFGANTADYVESNN